jgi:hypothetical protein
MKYEYARAVVMKNHSDSSSFVNVHTTFVQGLIRSKDKSNYYTGCLHRFCPWSIDTTLTHYHPQMLTWCSEEFTTGMLPTHLMAPKSLPYHETCEVNIQLTPPSITILLGKRCNSES